MQNFKTTRFINLFLCFFFLPGELDISFLYAKDNPLRWDYQMFSYYFGLKYAIGSLILVICTPIIKYFNISDFHICYVGIISKIAGLVLLSFSNKDYLMFLGNKIFIFKSCIYHFLQKFSYILS